MTKSLKVIIECGVAFCNERIAFWLGEDIYRILKDEGWSVEPIGGLVGDHEVAYCETCTARHLMAKSKRKSSMCLPVATWNPA